jgi:hypothetical protein
MAHPPSKFPASLQGIEKRLPLFAQAETILPV